MDRVEHMLLRMTELQPQIPFWAKAENMELCTPQKELWKYAEKPFWITIKGRKRKSKKK